MALVKRLNEHVSIAKVQHVRGEGENEHQVGGTNTSTFTNEDSSMVTTVAAVAPRAARARAGSDDFDDQGSPVVGQDRTGSISTKSTSFDDHGSAVVDFAAIQPAAPDRTASMTTNSADLKDQAGSD